MPGSDKTGPFGNGAMTGRGIGICSENENLQNDNFYGFRRRGRVSKNSLERNRNRFQNSRPTNFENNESLLNRIDDLENEIQLLRKELHEIRSND